MINILCYGDSNTYGWDAEHGVRLEKKQRWPGVAQQALGDSYNLIEEGLPGRTTVWYDPVMDLISGADYLFPCLCTHQPLDMVVLMLGTNDLKYMFSATPFDVFWGMERVLAKVCNFRSEFTANPPKAFLLAPPLICDPKDHFSQMFKDAEEKSSQLAPYYQTLAKKYDTIFLDAAQIVKPNAADGIHLDGSAHQVLGEKIAFEIKQYFNVE